MSAVVCRGLLVVQECFLMLRLQLLYVSQYVS